MQLHGSAATVVLLRDTAAGLEVLLLQRPSHRGSFAGAWVFPGGLVDPEDYAGGAGTETAAGSGAVAAPDAAAVSGAAAAPDAVEAEAWAVRQAGIRETEEETGLVLSSAELAPLSCWLPPAEIPRRYRTWFFLAAAPEGEVRLSADEHTAFAWISPADALDRHRAGTMDLVTPTWVTLHHLAGFATGREALDAAATAAPETFHSRQLPGADPDTSIVIWQDDAEYPGVAPAAGGRHRLVMKGRNWSYERSAAARH